LEEKKDTKKITDHGGKEDRKKREPMTPCVFKEVVAEKDTLRVV